MFVNLHAFYFILCIKMGQWIKAKFYKMNKKRINECDSIFLTFVCVYLCIEYNYLENILFSILDWKKLSILCDHMRYFY